MELIDRQAAIDAVNEYLRLSEVSKTVQNMTSIQAILRWLPTVDAVEVVHGEWNQIEIIDDDSGNGVNDDASQCSVCGDVFDSYYWAKTYFNYCPNCGAKMRGENNG